MQRILACIILAVVCAAFTGCSVYMAANQPTEKDLSLLNPGQSRARLIAEFGQPIQTEVKNGARHDIFQWTQGYNPGVLAGRAVGHAAADVFTLGLWEAVGTPTEGYFNGTQLSAEVVYDREDRVVQVIPLKGEAEIVTGSTAAHPQESGSTAARPQE
jgi:hypothetical protein